MEKITTHAGIPGFILTGHVELAKGRATKAADTHRRLPEFRRYARGRGQTSAARKFEARAAAPGRGCRVGAPRCNRTFNQRGASYDPLGSRRDERQVITGGSVGSPGHAVTAQSPGVRARREMPAVSTRVIAMANLVLSAPTLVGLKVAAGTRPTRQVSLSLRAASASVSHSMKFNFSGTGSASCFQQTGSLVAIKNSTCFLAAGKDGRSRAGSDVCASRSSRQ